MRLEDVIPSREEKLRLHVEVDKCARDRYKEDLDRLFNSAGDDGGYDTPEMVEGDTLKVDYSVYVTYFGAVAKNLETLIKLREDGYKVTVDLTEMLHGRSLLCDLVNHMDTFISSASDPEESQSSEDS